MYSICTACENGFDGKLNELWAWQLPGIKCTERDAPHLCENSKGIKKGTDYNTDFFKLMRGPLKAGKPSPEFFYEDGMFRLELYRK